LTTLAALPLVLLLLEAREAEVRHALPPALLVAVILHESGGRRRLLVLSAGLDAAGGNHGPWPAGLRAAPEVALLPLALVGSLLSGCCTAERSGYDTYIHTGIAHPPRLLSYR